MKVLHHEQFVLQAASKIDPHLRLNYASRVRTRWRGLREIGVIPAAPDPDPVAPRLLFSLS